MAIYKEEIIKVVCDRCGESLKGIAIKYPDEWQKLLLHTTGAEIDLCGNCNDELLDFLKAKDADYMELATHKEEVVL